MSGQARRPDPEAGEAGKPIETDAPKAAFLEEMAKDLASYGTELVGPPGPPERR